MPCGRQDCGFQVSFSSTNSTGVAVILINTFQTVLVSDQSHVANGDSTLLWPLRNSFHRVRTSTVRETILTEDKESRIVYEIPPQSEKAAKL
jgi:hypothetical protein